MARFHKARQLDSGTSRHSAMHQGMHSGSSQWNYTTISTIRNICGINNTVKVFNKEKKGIKNRLLKIIII